MFFVGTMTGGKGRLVFEFDVAGNGVSEYAYFGKRMYQDAENGSLFDYYAKIDYSKVESCLNYDVTITKPRKCISVPKWGVKTEDGFVYEFDDYVICDKEYAVERGWLNE